MLANNTSNAQQMATFDMWELRCGYVNQDDNKSNLVDFMASTSSTILSVSCETSPCQPRSVYTITSEWLGRGQGKVNRDQNYNQSISLEIRP